MGDFLEMYDGLPFADGSDKKEVSPECQKDHEITQLNPVDHETFFAALDGPEGDNAIASEIASTFPVGGDETP